MAHFVGSIRTFVKNNKVAYRNLGELIARALEAWQHGTGRAGIRIDANDLKQVREEMARLHGGFREARAKAEP